ncbi:hypothetical protein V9T40_011211 [Parthenolecanium corni]|uniref:Uncharacterized protein n=1 Tax=Parthenolecanium corni TaxID=536013 RepID=A0AAN9T5M5_9HEMI
MGGVPKFYGHDPPIAALLVLGMIAAGARCDRDEDPAAAPREGTEKGATSEDRELGPRGASSARMLTKALLELGQAPCRQESSLNQTPYPGGGERAERIAGSALPP